MANEIFLSELEKVLTPAQFTALKRLLMPKCTTARMTYQLTYRALRQFANGRISHHPIETMQQMETVVPFSVCSHTHDVMMKANRSFNQRCEKPSIVHECLYECRGKDMCAWPLHISQCNGDSWLRSWNDDKIYWQLEEARSRAYAKTANHSWKNIHFTRLDAKARAIKATQDLPLFA